MTFTHLQIRSGYSLMRSSITIDKLVQQAKTLGFSAIALTDEHVMYGAVSFYQACLRGGIKPILGLSIHVEDEKGMETCIVLAKNNAGYQQLLKLSSYIELHGLSAIDKQNLASYLSDLIVILPAQQTRMEELQQSDQHLVEAYIKDWLKFVTEEDFYLGVQDFQSEEEKNQIYKIKQMCEQLNVRATAISDVRYLNSGDRPAYDCLRAIDRGVKWNADSPNNASQHFHLKSEHEMEEYFGNVWPELLIETNNIADRCQVELDFTKRMLPTYPVSVGETAFSFLERLCFERLPAVYDPVTEAVTERLSYELKVIQSMQFSDYFLIVWDFIRFAKQEKIIVGPGRGSAAGSLVAYLLGITDVDPIRYQLLFERFLNPERMTMPDIDIDFSDHRRDEVLAYVRQKYGQDHVAQIITFGTFAARSLLRELIKVMDIDQQDAAFLLKEIPVQSQLSIVESVKQSDALTSYVKKSQQLQLLFKIAAKLEGLPRHISTHAAGVIISDRPLVEHVPLTASSTDMNLTQYPMNDLEAVGLLKMDFLGLRNLTLLERIWAAISSKQLTKDYWNSIPFDDHATFSLLQRGQTNGIFQLESQGMQKVLTQLKPTTFEDIVAVNALYRPGPMEYIPVYIKRKHKEEQVSYPHQDLQPILEKTYGVLVYQEQIMQIANRFAGFSLGQADILRRAVSKKQLSIFNEQRAFFIKGCIAKGYKQEVAEQIFDWIVQFANYGFNRSHAVAYSVISYHLAYLKAHYPAHFFAEVLSSVSNNQDKLRLYIREAKGFNVDVLAPSINDSFGKFTVEKNQIRMGLSTIKGVGIQAVKEIVRARKDGSFKHLFDFCLRVPLKVVTRQVIEALIMAGAFDDTYKNRASLLASIDQAIEQGELFREFEDQPSFFQNDVEFEVSYLETEDFTQMKKLAFEKDVLGVYMSDHPLASHRAQLRAKGYIPLVDTAKYIGNKHCFVSAVIQEIKTIRTKRGEPMSFLSLGDERGEIDAVLFPDLHREVNRWLKEESIVFITGKVEQRDNRIQLILADVKPFNEEVLLEDSGQRLFIKVSDENDSTALTKLKQFANLYPGDVPVILYHDHRKKTYQLSSEYNLKPTHELIKSCQQAFGKGNVAIQNKK
ncbi:DNA polymerase III subunit alpha [Radiobacillus sp. PE A8.2]|uniref:DNA polymerase III subunit alpha n=1 Tax=Radiobacillus sp. PE A8.2 TaxID=3380349 RepID=UPI00388DDFC7